MDRNHLLVKSFVVVSFLMVQSNVLAQSDSTQKALNQLSFSMNILTHGETCGGGLPRTEKDGPKEDKSRFMVGRTRLYLDYQRQGLQAHAIIQNKAIWGMSGNQALNMYE